MSMVGIIILNILDNSLRLLVSWARDPDTIACICMYMYLSNCGEHW